MKRRILIATALLIVVQLFSQEKDYSLAKVGEKIRGVYIFVNCEPANEYDYIATIDVRWNEGNPEGSFLEIIEKAKKKYPNFDALIFKNARFETADLVKFRGLELSGGGFRVGDFAFYNANGKPVYLEIIKLDNPKQEAGYKYFNEYGEEKVGTVVYSKLSKSTKEQYEKIREQKNIEIQKHQFQIGEKVSFADGSITIYGEVESLNTKSHDATVKSKNKYGEDKNTTIDFLKLDKIEDSKFQEFRLKELEEINKHQFVIGQKVSFTKDNKTKYGEVVNLNSQNHKATIKYLGLFAEDKTSQEEYFGVEKISEEKYNEETANCKKEAMQYKFEIGEKVVWKKVTLLSNESINVEISSLIESEHKATVKFSDKDRTEKQETVSYLNLIKIK